MDLPLLMLASGSDACFEGHLPAGVAPVAVGEGRGRRWGAGGKFQALENGLRGVGPVDRGEEPHATPASRALQDVHREDAPQELGPSQASWTGRRHVGRRRRVVRGAEV
jgi:hypothetical protein